jgi:hypothetical protein
MPSGILMLVRGLQWVVLTLQRTRSFITVGLARGLRRVILGWHLPAPPAEMPRLRLHVPAGNWFCDGRPQVLWDVDSFRLTRLGAVTTGAKRPVGPSTPRAHPRSATATRADPDRWQRPLQASRRTPEQTSVPPSRRPPSRPPHTDPRRRRDHPGAHRVLLSRLPADCPRSSSRPCPARCQPRRPARLRHHPAGRHPPHEGCPVLRGPHSLRGRPDAPRGGRPMSPLVALGWPTDAAWFCSSGPRLLGSQ